jgi:hypothetical protein
MAWRTTWHPHPLPPSLQAEILQVRAVAAVVKTLSQTSIISSTLTLSRTSTHSFALCRAAAAKAHAPASAAKGAKGRRQAPLPIASESDAPATIVAPATVSAPTSSVIQHNARTAAAAPTTSAASVLQAPPPAARAADSNKGGWKKRTKPELAPQRITPQKSQPPTPAMAAPHVEETMEPEPESQGTQEMWSEGVTCKRARKVSVVRSPIRQSAPMVKRARSRHSTPVSARKADSCMHGSQAAATSRCG